MGGYKRGTTVYTLNYKLFKNIFLFIPTSFIKKISRHNVWAF